MASLRGRPAAAPARPVTTEANGRLTGRVVVTASVSTPLRSAAYASRRVERVGRSPAASSRTSSSSSRMPPRVAAFPTIRAADRAAGRKLLAAGRRDHARIDGRLPQRGPVLPRRLLVVARREVRSGSYPRGSSRSRQFPRAGLVKVYCHIHSQMSASILVFDHPYFTIPAPTERSRSKDFPPARIRSAPGTSGSARTRRRSHRRRARSGDRILAPVVAPR